MRIQANDPPVRTLRRNGISLKLATVATLLVAASSIAKTPPIVPPVQTDLWPVIEHELSSVELDAMDRPDPATLEIDETLALLETRLEVSKTAAPENPIQASMSLFGHVASADGLSSGDFLETSNLIEIMLLENEVLRDPRGNLQYFKDLYFSMLRTRADVYDLPADFRGQIIRAVQRVIDRLQLVTDPELDQQDLAIARDDLRSALEVLDTLVRQHRPQTIDPRTASASRAPRAGTMSGTVTDSTTTDPIEGVQVRFYASSGSGYSSTYTDVDGIYSYGYLNAGNYYVQTYSDTHIGELYDNVSCPFGCSLTTGDIVSVTDGGTTSSIDFALDDGGAISGTVTDATSGALLAGVYVTVYDTSGNYLRGVNTDSNGFYTLGGLPTGSFHVRTYSNTHIGELYNGITCPYGDCTITTGATIGVTQGTSVSGIDFALIEGGIITGNVTDEAQAPLSGVTVNVYDSSGNWLNSLSTDSNGDYLLPGLPSGSFRVVANSQTHVGELYDDIPCLNCSPATVGTSIAVTQGSAMSGIDIALGTGGSFSGTVTDSSTTNPLASVRVNGYDAAGIYIGYDYTDANGDYTFAGLPTGNYYAYTGSSTHLNELYDDIPCSSCTVTTGTAVTVTAGATTSGIDFALDEGGKITGTLTDSATTNPLTSSNVYVRAYDSVGNQLGYAYPDSNGFYTLGGLVAGDYFVRRQCPRRRRN